jgi:hypothetical protein
MKVYQIISENTLADFKREFSALPVQDQKVFRKLISTREGDIADNTEKQYKGESYLWDADKGQWKKKSNGRMIDPDNSILHLTLFVDEQVSKQVFNLYQRAKKAGEIKKLNQELSKNNSAAGKFSKAIKNKISKTIRGKGKKTRTGNLVRDMQKATGRKGPSKDPGEGPD